MGVKLFPNVNSIAASFIKGVFTFNIDKEVITFEIPAVKTLVFPKQCIMLQSPIVYAYLVNNKYKIILRTNGTGTLALLDGALVKNFSYESPEVKCTYHSGGALMSTDINTFDYCSVDLIKYKDSYILSASEFPISLTFNEDDNEEYLDACTTSGGVGYPKLVWDKDAHSLTMVDMFDNAIMYLNGELNSGTFRTIN